MPTNLEGRYRDLINLEVIFGIRPEHINDRAFAADVPGRDELKATVDVTEPVGSEVILIVTVGEHQLTAKVDPHIRASAHRALRRHEHHAPHR